MNVVRVVISLGQTIKLHLIDRNEPFQTIITNIKKKFLIPSDQRIILMNKQFNAAVEDLDVINENEALEITLDDKFSSKYTIKKFIKNHKKHQNLLFKENQTIKM